MMESRIACWWRPSCLNSDWTPFSRLDLLTLEFRTLHQLCWILRKLTSCSQMLILSRLLLLVTSTTSRLPHREIRPWEVKLPSLSHNLVTFSMTCVYTWSCNSQLWLWLLRTCPTLHWCAGVHSQVSVSVRRLNSRLTVILWITIMIMMLTFTVSSPCSQTRWLVGTDVLVRNSQNRDSLTSLTGLTPELTQLQLPLVLLPLVSVATKLQLARRMLLFTRSFWFHCCSGVIVMFVWLCHPLLSLTVSVSSRLTCVNHKSWLTWCLAVPVLSVQQALVVLWTILTC
jgi:hypothetical protein